MNDETREIPVERLKGYHMDNPQYLQMAKAKPLKPLDRALIASHARKWLLPTIFVLIILSGLYAMRSVISG